MTPPPERAGRGGRTDRAATSRRGSARRTASGEETPRERSLTLERGLTLLSAVAEAESEALTISELAGAIGVSRAAIYRLLGPLQKRGLVRRDGSRVRLGLGLMWLSGQVLPQLRTAVRPALRDLAERTGATAHLTVAEGGEAQAVAVVEPSWTSFHVAYRVGTRHSLERGAAGRAIAALESGSHDDAGDQWVSSTGELQTGACGVAAPVHGVTGLHASVGVVSLSTLEPDVLGPVVVEAAGTVAAALG